MPSISRPLNAASVSAYFRAEYNTNASYYVKETETLHGEWIGKLADTLGLGGKQVSAEAFDRLALGQHPQTGEQLIKHRATALTEAGKEVEHRAGWDITFSCGKSVSVTALAGGDTRIIEAHRAAVRAAMHEYEALIQCHLGGTRGPQTTGRMVAATFDHDTSRPVDGYAACQLHTHVVLMNLTEDDKGQARSLQTHEIYVATSMAEAVYQNHMEIELRKLGYQTELGKNYTVEIAGYTPEYLASESLRSKQIADLMEEKGLTGAESRFLAAHSTRESKLKQSPEEVKVAHRANAAKHGNQPKRIVAEAAERETLHVKPMSAEAAVRFARLSLSERNSVFDHVEVVRDALRYARGRTDLPSIKAEIERAVEAGEFIPVSHVRPTAPLFRYTTPQLIDDERAVIEKVCLGESRAPINRISDEVLQARFPMLNEWQRRIIRESLGSEMQITGIQGSAGSGKSTSLATLRELAEEAGWSVQGLAPTSSAARELRNAGIAHADTLQKFLMYPSVPSPKRVFFLDESSLAATRQLRAFLDRIGTGDRVVIVGDRRQHSSVEAGRIFEELQIAGMETARINKLVRQSDPGLKEVVKAMAQGRIEDGVSLLKEQGRVTEVEHRTKRFQAIAQAYAEHPEGTLVISPDNASRHELTREIRQEFRARDLIGKDIFTMPILIARQNITGMDRTLADSYRVGDVVKYRAGSKHTGIESGQYSTVIKADRETNMITVKTENGRTVTYNPEKLKGVSIYSPEMRAFALGDRIQFTAPGRAQGVSNRDVGTVIKLDTSGNVRLKLDDGRTVGFNLRANRHIDHGFVSTSHAAQGQTVDRVLLNIDTGDSRSRNLINRTLGYVALSRPRHEAHVFTDNLAELTGALSRVNEKSTALSMEQMREYRSRGQAV